MPANELEVVDARRHRLRHVKPWKPGEGTIESSQTVLGRQYAFRELPIADVPTSRDFSDASWTSRLGDAGELEVTFPNKEASDGQPWRNRFNVAGHLEFIEVYRDDVMEHVDCLLSASPDQQKVIVKGQDGWFLLRDAYERNYVCVMAPRDVIERYTYVWTLTLGNTWSKSPEAEGWTFQLHEVSPGISVITFVFGGGIEMYISSTSPGTNAWAKSISPVINIPSDNRWRLVLNFLFTQEERAPLMTFSLASQTTGAISTLYIWPTESEGTGEGIAEFSNPSLLGGHRFKVTLPQGFKTGPHTIQMESDGRFIRCYLDGYFIGELLYDLGETIKAIFYTGSAVGTGFSGLTRVRLQEFIFRQTEPFLLRGTEKGDYVLPGTIHTYPFGGLTGRYYNDLDLQEYTEYWQLCFAQERSLNKQIQYQDRTDSTIGVLGGSIEAPPFPGASVTFWSCRWFGAVYLKLSAGNYVFKIGVGPTTGVRLWVGKTQFGAQIIDSWTNGGTRNVEVTLNAASLGGKDGWYPLILEFFSGSEGNTDDYVWLSFKPPVTYTDPGGTSLTAMTFIGVPATSLSPLGCVDQHFQGQSHYNLTKEIAEAFGYQMYCEPRQLESGMFPGQLIPRVHAGRETDEILEPDSITSHSPIVNYKNTVDATDQITSLLGTGAGLPNGQNGQISAEEINLEALAESLFDLQGWLDASDTNSPSLLSARVASQLALQTEPWQNVEGEPLARDRLSDTFPLTGVLAAMRWRPGDGIRIHIPEVNIYDTTPRQILQVTRQFGPVGRHGTQMGFRQRPLDRVSQINRLVRRAMQPQRNYQKQIVTLPATQLREEIGPGAEGGAWSIIPILQSDIIIRAQLLIVYNNANQPLHLIINGVDVTGSFGGPWGTVPVAISLSALQPQGGARQAAYVRLKNAGGSATFVEAVPFVTVLR